MMSLSCKRVLHSYITLPDKKLCFLIIFNLQQFIIVDLKEFWVSWGFFFSLPRDRALKELLSYGGYDSHPYTQDYTRFHKPMATVSAHVWAQSKNLTSKKQKVFYQKYSRFYEAIILIMHRKKYI